MPGSSTHVVLVEPEIHWNTGNAGRTCLAAGAQLHLVGPLGFSLDTKAVRRAGLDYWPKVEPMSWAGWQQFEAAMFDLGEPFLLSPDGDRDYWDVRYPADTVLIFGKESVGFPLAVRKRHKDRLVRIPIAPNSVRSLNLSTCVGIVLFERLRQARP